MAFKERVLKEDMMNKATYISKTHNFANAEQRYYKVEPPLCGYDYVIVSALVRSSGPETMVFPANKNAEIVSISDLPGSYRGGLDHEEALRRAGYEVA